MPENCKVPCKSVHDEIGLIYNEIKTKTPLKIFITLIGVMVTLATFAFSLTAGMQWKTLDSVSIVTKDLSDVKTQIKVQSVKVENLTDKIKEEITRATKNDDLHMKKLENLDLRLNHK